jgi:hypothetical protein
LSLLREQLVEYDYFAIRPNPYFHFWVGSQQLVACDSVSIHYNFTLESSSNSKFIFFVRWDCWTKHFVHKKKSRAPCCGAVNSDDVRDTYRFLSVLVG